MTLLFAVPLMVGILAMMMWIAAVALSASVQGWESYDPESRFGRPGRFAIASLFGFGMAGISALYAGWSDIASVGAAIIGAVLLVVVANVLGPSDSE